MLITIFKIILGYALFAGTLVVCQPQLTLTVYQNPSTMHDSVCSSGATSMTVNNGTCVNIPSGYNSVKAGALTGYAQAPGCLLFFFINLNCNPGTVTAGLSIDPSDSAYGQCKDTISYNNGPSDPSVVPKAVGLYCLGVTSSNFLDLLNSLQTDFDNLVALAKAWEEAILNGQTSKRKLMTRSGASTSFQMFSSAENLLAQRFNVADGEAEQAYETGQIDIDVYRAYRKLRDAFNNGFKDIATWTATNLANSKAAVSAGAISGGLLAILIGTFLNHNGNGGAVSNPTTRPLPSSTTTTTTTSSTTCSPQQTPTQMVILTTTSGTAAQFKDLVNTLPKGSYVDQIVYDTVNYRACLATLDDCQAAQVALNPIVEMMTLNSDVQTEEFGAVVSPSKLAKKRSMYPKMSLEKRLDANVNLVLQKPSPPHLRWLSGFWHQVGLAGTYLGFQDFLYDDNTGSSSTNIQPTVYVLDTGADTSHPDIANQIARTFDSSPGETFHDINGHGTCMASLIGGHYSGVSKFVSLVPIKIRDAASRAGVTRQWNMANTFGYIINDVQTRNLQGRAVISVSAGINPSGIWYSMRSPSAPITVLHDFFQVMLPRIYALGIVFVTSAGNEATTTGSNAQNLNWQTPRKHGGAGTPMIVVGSANEDGTRYEQSNFLDPQRQGILTIYANGVNVQCAGASNIAPNPANYWLVPPNGTSQAAAQVAGLAAYYLRKTSLRGQWIQEGGVGSVPMKMKQFLINLAHQQKGVVWNDGIPRAALGETINCTTSSPASHAPVPAYIAPSTATGLRLTTTSVTQGQSTVMPANQLLTRDVARMLPDLTEPLKVARTNVSLGGYWGKETTDERHKYFKDHIPIFLVTC